MKGKSAHFASQFMPMELKRVMLKAKILGRLKHGRIYSYAMIKEFENSGFADLFGPTIKNDTYNALNVLTKAGYIRLQHKMEGGKVKNYYTLTKSGEIALKSIGRLMVRTLREASNLFK